ncbi:MAG: response regulator, partial [Verrucomicrobiota bacterium]
MDELSPPFASCLSFRIAHPLSAALNILVVDDHPVNRQVCALMLRELGCVAEYAACGGEALEMIAAKGYDLILMDCIMPGMDGLAASR